MGTRLDMALQKFPEHEEGIRALAAHDPSGNLKYLDWSAKMLASGQALAPEIADVVDLFHRFAGQRIEMVGRRHGLHGHHQNGARIHSDIHTYRPQDLAALRNNLLKMKRARDRKQRKREQLYRIEGSVEADTVYDSPDLIVRHIKNKQASVHYGLSTKWCIAMLREGYFEDYGSHNATFFFFERKVPVGDEFDKVALMVARSRGMDTEAFTALDRHVDMLSLARVYGSRIFDIYREIHERSERYPGSAISCVYAGTATPEQVEATLASIKRDRSQYHHETFALIEAICCNDAAPFPLLEEVARTATKLVTTAWRRSRRRGSRLRGIQKNRLQELERIIMSALFVHPNVPADARDRIAKNLRRRHIKLEAVHRVVDSDRVGVSYRSGDVNVRGRRVRYRRRRRPITVKALRKRAQMFDRAAATVRKKAKKLQQKLTAKKIAKLKER